MVLVFAGLLYYLYGGHQVPSGQAPLADLTAANIDDVKTSFNQAQTEVRLLVLLSPT